MTRGEAARRAEGFQVEAPPEDGRVIANGGDGEAAAARDGVHAEALEHAEGDPLRHALGQPLLGAPLALRQLDLRYVRQLVRDQPHPFGARDVALVVQQQLPTLADADREVAELRGPHSRDLAIGHEPLLEDLARRVDVHHHRVGQRQADIVRDDPGDRAHGGLVRREIGDDRRRQARRGLHPHRDDGPALRAAGDRDGEGDEQNAAQASSPARPRASHHAHLSLRSPSRVPDRRRRGSVSRRVRRARQTPVKRAGRS